jgi:uncharacterized membrane protein
MNAGLIVYAIFLFFNLLLCLLILLPAFLMNTGHDLIAEHSYSIFSGLCHQLSERSIHLFGHKLAVCARCSGVYFGMLLSTIAYPLLKGLDNRRIPAKYVIVGSVLPLALDGVTQLTGFRESSNLLRFGTGLVFGLAIPFYLIPLFTEGVEDFSKPVFKKTEGDN